MDQIRVFDGVGDHIIQIDNYLLLDLLRQTAKNIINTCIDVEGYLEGNLTQMEKSDCIAVINEFQSQVVLLYTLVAVTVRERKESWSTLKPIDAYLFVQALETYQSWKTAHVDLFELRKIEELGIHSSFRIMDWTDEDERFLELYAPAKVQETKI